MKKNRLILVWFGVLLISMMSVMAVDRLTFVTGGNLSNRGNFSTINETDAGADTAQGGNVTYMNISTTAATVKWQGYYGTVAANLLIGSVSGSNLAGGLATLYSWGAAQTTQVKTVFAATSSAFDWSALTAASAANVNTLDAQLGWSSADTDSANSTFDDATETVARTTSVRTALLNSYANMLNRSDDASALISTAYNTGVFTDGGTLVNIDDYAFGGVVNQSGIKDGTSLGGARIANNKAFDNNTAIDYELLLPTNGSLTAAAPSGVGIRGVTTYYFWLDVE